MLAYILYKNLHPLNLRRNNLRALILPALRVASCKCLSVLSFICSLPVFGVALVYRLQYVKDHFSAGLQ